MAISDKRIIFETDEGGIAIMVPSDKCGLTIEQIQAKDVPSGKTSYIVDKSVVPTDRSFRDAWVYTTGEISGVDINMTKAREIHKNNIRWAREPKLAELDIQFQRALETSADTTTIVASKQALRDAPAAAGITTAANATELKAQWDTSLLGTSPYS
tara:strand:+ start:523 stop:990 length:468 start_codon:yes stop_codon:yes gene_type:complete